MTTLRMVLLSAWALLLRPAVTAAQAPAVDLRGLWEATLRYGPDIHGPLIVLQTGEGWRADIAGLSVPARVQGETIAFGLAAGWGRSRAGRTGRMRGMLWRPSRAYY